MNILIWLYECMCVYEYFALQARNTRYVEISMYSSVVILAQLSLSSSSMLRK